MVVTLVLVAAVLAPASVVARWAHDEVADTDRYVETVAPLAQDPAVQQAVVDRVTAELFARIDVKAVTDQAVAALANQGLPPRVTVGLTALSAPLASGIESFVREQITKLVESDVFAAAWVQANREAHAQMVAVLSGQGTDAVAVKGDTVSINLATVIDVVKKRLSDAGFTLAERIPTVNAQFTIFQSADLTKAQTAFRMLDTLANWLPVLALLLLALAVYVARRRRQTLIWSAVAVAASMLVLGAALNIFRPVYLNAIDPRVLPTDAAAAIYDQLVGFIRLNLRAVLVVALAVAAGAWVTGPVRGGDAGALSRGVGWLRGGAEHAGSGHRLVRSGGLPVAVGGCAASSSGRRCWSTCSRPTRPERQPSPCSSSRRWRCSWSSSWPTRRRPDGRAGAGLRGPALTSGGAGAARCTARRWRWRRTQGHRRSSRAPAGACCRTRRRGRAAPAPPRPGTRPAPGRSPGPARA